VLYGDNAVSDDRAVFFRRVGGNVGSNQSALHIGCFLELSDSSS
jgi:hypothetical protein